MRLKPTAKNSVGGKTSHTAILAQSLEIPAVVGLSDVSRRIKTGDIVILDGEQGMVIIAPGPWDWLSDPLLYVAVVLTVLSGAYYFLMKGLETVSPTISSIVLPIEVIVAVLLSVIIFNDPFNFYSATGAVLIIAGVGLVSTAP